jgi:hypothetical protein
MLNGGGGFVNTGPRRQIQPNLMALSNAEKFAELL